MPNEIDIMDRGGDRGLPDRGNLIRKITSTTGLTGTITDKQVAFGDGNDDIAGSDDLTWDGSTVNIGQGQVRLNKDGSASFVGGNIRLGPAGGGQVLAGQFNGETAFLDSFLDLTPSDRPGLPGEGTIYQDSVDHFLYVFNGSVWKRIVLMPDGPLPVAPTDINGIIQLLADSGFCQQPL